MQTKKRAMPLTLGSTLIALLLFTYYAYTWRNAFNFRTAIDTCSETFCDFATYYYPMGESIFHTALPVEGFVYSPFIALLFALFAPLGSDIALLLWGILQGVFILLYIALFRRLIPGEQGIQLLFVFLTLSSFPILHHLAWGQVGIITTVSILGAPATPPDETRHTARPLSDRSPSPAALDIPSRPPAYAAGRSY